jgi:hypothetical protein
LWLVLDVKFCLQFLNVVGIHLYLLAQIFQFVLRFLGFVDGGFQILQTASLATSFEEYL